MHIFAALFLVWLLAAILRAPSEFEIKARHLILAIIEAAGFAVLWMILLMTFLPDPSTAPDNFREASVLLLAVGIVAIVVRHNRKAKRELAQSQDVQK